MFVKLAVLACVAALSSASNWGGAPGRWVSNSPHVNDPIPPGISPPAQFPAGVSPHACPNYPNCGNPALAAAPDSHQGGWNGGGNQGGWNGGNQGAWNGGNQGAWNGGNQGGWNGGNNVGNNGGLDSGEYTGDGDYRGEGLLESGAFGDNGHNNGGWDNGANNGAWNNGGNNGAWNGAQAGAWNGAQAGAHVNQLPAGVEAGACPNYPYCH